MQEETMEAGIFGGTFDPPHNGHLALCRTVIGSGLVDRLLVVPCLVHAFRKQPVSFEHRVAMCELMVGTEREISVSEAEAAIEEPGKTLMLVRHLMEENPGVGFRLVVGSDIYHERDRWYEFDKVARLAPPIYVERRGVEPIPEPVLEAPPRVSSRDVRHALERGVVPTDLLPEAVAAYIVSNQLYGVR
jgi:nicotinate-nucleotide adenylyltransferase